MKVNGPKDLPELRMWLIDEWRGGALKRHYDGPAGAFTGIEWDTEADRLSRAALWWIEPDMCTLVDRASRSLPTTTFNDDLLVDEFGLAVFAEPLTGSSVDDTGPVSVHAILWGLGMHRTTGLPIVGMTMYTYGGATRRHIGTDWGPLGLTTWVVGSNTEEYWSERHRTDTAAASQAEDRRWLAALHLLASQPLAESTTEHAPRHAARRSAKRNVASDVRVVNLRHRPSRSGGIPSGSGGDRRKPDHRWIVGENEGGFWKNQAYGPGWKQHRPIFIEAYEAGPKDKPLRTKEKVKVLRDDGSSPRP